MNKLLPFFLLILFVSNTRLLQSANTEKSDTMILTGQVFGSETQELLNNAVFYKSGKIYTLDSLAGFRFPTFKNDTIVFHLLGYKDLMLIVNDSIINNELLTGVFLAQQAHELSEVVVVPRYVNLQAMMQSNPIEIDNNELIAKKNFKLLTYQGLINSAPEWDASSNQKFAIQKQSVSVIYKGMISPNNMVGVNVVGVSEKYLTPDGIKDRPNQLDLGTISTTETHYLQTVFKALKHERELKNKIASDSLLRNLSPVR